MSFLTEPNKDALIVSPGLVSSPPRQGLLGAFEASIDAQVRYGNQFGAAIALRDEEEANLKLIRSLGEQPPEPLDTGMFGLSPGTARYSEFRDAYVKMDPREVQGIMGTRNEYLKALKAKYPEAGIKTYDDMFTAVQTKSDDARARAAKDKDLGGAIGSFLGGAVGFLDPRTNPLGFASIAVGGFGPTAAVRIGVEALAQAGAQAVQLPGSFANERSLGGDPTLEEGIASVLYAGLGGALFRGAGEGIGALGRRAFSDAPLPPVEPPTPPAAFKPLSGVDAVIANMDRTRIGTTRSVLDFEHVSQQLEAWDGPTPNNLRPPTDVRLPWEGPTPGEPLTNVRIKSTLGVGETLDEVARRLDPQAFNIYDKLIEREKQVRGILAKEDTPQAQALTAARSTIDVALETATARLAAAKTVKQQAKIQEEITALRAQAAQMAPARPTAILHEHVSSGVVGRRAELQRLETSINELRPTITRAYARAQDKWHVYEDQRAQIQAMMDARAKTLEAPRNIEGTIEGASKAFRQTDPALLAPDTSAAMARVNSLMDDPRIAARVPDDADAADVLTISIDENLKIIDEALEAFTKSTADLLAQAKGSEIFLQGVDVPLNLDGNTIHVVDAITGETKQLTVRDFLAEIQKDSDALAAVNVCAKPL
jgi:predicted  nucleic acid-binding Zn-ribbon protein